MSTTRLTAVPETITWKATRARTCFVGGAGNDSLVGGEDGGTLEQAQRIAGHASPTDPVDTAGATAIRAAHLMEPRAAVAALE